MFSFHFGTGAPFNRPAANCGNCINSLVTMAEGMEGDSKAVRKCGHPALTTGLHILLRKHYPNTPSWCPKLRA